jgi:hypothetical protein
MKKYGILLSVPEHRHLKMLAAERDMAMQDIARNAVLAAINGGAAPVNTLASDIPDVLGFLNLIAAKRPSIAKDLDRLIRHIAQECQDIAPDPIADADAALAQARDSLGEAHPTSRRKKGA